MSRLDETREKKRYTGGTLMHARTYSASFSTMSVKKRQRYSWQPPLPPVDILDVRTVTGTPYHTAVTTSPHGPYFVPLGVLCVADTVPQLAHFSSHCNISASSAPRVAQLLVAVTLFGQQWSTFARPRPTRPQEVALIENYRERELGNWRDETRLCELLRVLRIFCSPNEALQKLVRSTHHADMRDTMAVAPDALMSPTKFCSFVTSLFIFLLNASRLSAADKERFVKFVVRYSCCRLSSGRHLSKALLRDDRNYRELARRTFTCFRLRRATKKIK